MDTRKTVSDRRGYPRIERRLPFRIAVGQDVLSAQTLDLSCSGVNCRVDRPIPEMTRLQVVLALIRGADAEAVIYVECEGIVVRCEPEPDGARHQVAVFFHDISASERNKLDRYIRHANTVATA